MCPPTTTVSVSLFVLYCKKNMYMEAGAYLFSDYGFKNSFKSMVPCSLKPEKRIHSYESDLAGQLPLIVLEIPVPSAQRVASAYSKRAAAR